MTNNEDNGIGIPEDTTWSPEELEELGKRPQLPEDPIAYVILKETTQVSKPNAKGPGGHFMIVWECAPLQDPDDITSVMDRYTLKNFTLLPKRNTKVPGHKPVDSTWKVIGAMRAIYGNDAFPYAPRFNRKTKEWEQNGEVLEGGADEAALKTDELKRTGLERAMEHYMNPGMANGKTFIANTSYSEEGYPRIKGIRNFLGDDETFADLSDF
jgi:hypothetical protein